MVKGRRAPHSETTQQSVDGSPRTASPLFVTIIGYIPNYISGCFFFNAQLYQVPSIDQKEISIPCNPHCTLACSHLTSWSSTIITAHGRPYQYTQNHTPSRLAATLWQAPARVHTYVQRARAPQEHDRKRFTHRFARMLPLPLSPHITLPSEPPTNTHVSTRIQSNTPQQEASIKQQITPF